MLLKVLLKMLKIKNFPQKNILIEIYKFSKFLVTGFKYCKFPDPMS